MLRMVRDLWRLSSQVSVNGKIPLVLYQSTRSNLKVAVADVPGPMVKGMISFATETSTDDGLPHTLEHLVFMGSQRYPYKGVLDIIANRCLASGTNAYTDQDHTAYTLSTVGSEGFLKVLPVYLDHLLSPNLTMSQYITEVHHITGEGEDAGVVYSEMQDHESEMESMMSFKRKELVYPRNSSYGVATGGRLGNLRNSCSNEKVRDYHKQYYHLRNVLVMVCGGIDHAKLLESIEPIEQRELNKIPADFERPFQAQIPALKGERLAKIVCPADDDTKGIVELAWLGPQASDLYKASALSVLFDYLTDTAVAPLKRDFVQTDDPFCSSVGVYMSEQSTCEIIMCFSGVPVAKLDEIRDRFLSKTVADHADLTSFQLNFDMERIGFIIDQSIKKYLSKVENNPSSQIFSALIGHQLYGDDVENSEQLRVRMNDIEVLKKLKREPTEFWHRLFNDTFNTPNFVCVVGEPSAKAVDEFSEKEESRIERQKEKLGEEGLKKCEEKLKQAIHENTVNKPSDEVLSNLIVKDLEKFNMFPVSTISNASDCSVDLINDLPFAAVLHNVPSEFVDMVLVIDTESIPLELRHYMLLWFELMFQSPAIVSGEKLSFEEVSKLATKDLVSNSIAVGVSGCYSHLVSLRLRVDSDNYDNLTKWAEIYLKNIVFEASRIAICAKKLANSAADAKRDGYSAVAFLSCDSIYNSDTNANFCGHIALEKFHKEVATQVETNPEFVIKKLSALRDVFLSSPINVHLACDPSKIQVDRKKNLDSWKFINSEARNAKHMLKCDPTLPLVNWSESAQKHGKRAMAVGGTESAFLLQKIEFNQSWKDWTNNSIMETMLLSQYLSQCEGPLWNGIRGNGLAYDASIYVSPDTKTLTLSLYRCSQISQAYEQTKKIVLDIIDSKKLDETQFEAAKRSLVCELIGAQGTIKSVAQTALLNTIRDVNQSLTMNLCSQIWHADMDDVLKKGAKPLLDLFNENSAVRSMVVNPAKINDLMKSFPDTELVKLEELQRQPPTDWK